MYRINKAKVWSYVRTALENYVMLLHFCCYRGTLYLMGKHLRAFLPFICPINLQSPLLLQKHDILPNELKEKISHTLWC